MTIVKNTFSSNILFGHTLVRFIVIGLAVVSSGDLQAQAGSGRIHTLGSSGAVISHGYSENEICGRFIEDQVVAKCPDGSDRYTLANVTETSTPNLWACQFEPSVPVCPGEFSQIQPTNVFIRRSDPFHCESPGRFHKEWFLGTGTSPIPSPTCRINCPVPYVLDEGTNNCIEPPNQDDCDECGKNPINFTRGFKYRTEVDYMGSGPFPLRIVRHYNNLGNRIRTNQGLVIEGEDNSVLPTGATSYTVPATASRIGFRTNEAKVLPEDYEDNPDPFFTANLSFKWRNFYERRLSANYLESGATTGVTPTVVNLYRYDGEKEVYVLDGGVYKSRNSYTSKIKLLQPADPGYPGWEVVNDENEIEIYDLEGQLQKISSPTGETHYLNYDPTGILLESVSDEYGNSLQFHRENIENPKWVTRITDPDGHDYRYEFTERGVIEKVIYPDVTPGDPNDNPYRLYQFNDSRYPDGITDIIDENGDLMAHYEYDDAGRAVATELGGSTSRFEVEYFDLEGGTTRTVTNEFGVESIYHLNDRGLIELIQRSASPTGLFPAASKSTSYDANGFKESETDWVGNTTEYQHDLIGRETSRTEAVGTANERTISTQWHSNFNLPVIIEEPGRTTNFVYDSLGRITKRTETDTTIANSPYSTQGQTREWNYTYHAEGENGEYQLATADGPRTDVVDVTIYNYTTSGFISSITNPLGQTVQYTAHNSKGQPLSMVDQNGVVTTMIYHPRGWMLTSTIEDPVGSENATTTNEYDDIGQLIKVTLPNGTFLSYEYDSAHRLTAISNNLGERQEFTLDDAGNITAEITKDSFGSISRTQTRVYDELNRIYEVVGGANQLARMSYDNNGNQLSGTLDPSGISQTTLQAFDALDRLITVTDAHNNDSDFTYDARDNLISVTDQRGLVTTYTYDGLNNLIQLDSPDTGITVYTYDDAGNQLSQTDARGVVTNYAYDALNRLVSVTYPTSSTENITYTYDQVAGGYGVGRLTQITDQTGTTSMVYDHRGNQVESTVTIQGNSYTTAYAYDLADNLTQTTYPSGRVVENQLDSLGRTASLISRASAGGSNQTLASNIDYLPFGPMRGLEYGNNLALAIGNDQDYRVTSIDVTDIAGVNPAIMGLSYTQNPVDNITAIANNIDAGQSQTFNYDLLNRLTGATGSYGDQNYSYDAVGNRLSLSTDKDGSTVNESYTYDTSSNRLLSVDKDGVIRSFQYDANGNIISDDRGADTGFTFDYNDQNRLDTATPQGAQ